MAEDLYAMLRIKMQISPQEFGKLTLRVLDLFCEKLAIDRHNYYYGHGITASVVANCHRDRRERSEPFTALDFIPGNGSQLLSGEEAADILGQICLTDRKG